MLVVTLLIKDNLRRITHACGADSDQIEAYDGALENVSLHFVRKFYLQMDMSSEHVAGSVFVDRCACTD